MGKGAKTKTDDVVATIGIVAEVAARTTRDPLTVVEGTAAQDATITTGFIFASILHIVWVFIE